MNGSQITNLLPRALQAGIINTSVSFALFVNVPPFCHCPLPRFTRYSAFHGGLISFAIVIIVCVHVVPVGNVAKSVDQGWSQLSSFLGGGWTGALQNPPAGDYAPAGGAGGAGGAGADDRTGSRHTQSATRHSALPQRAQERTPAAPLGAVRNPMRGGVGMGPAHVPSSSVLEHFEQTADFEGSLLTALSQRRPNPWLDNDEQSRRAHRSEQFVESGSGQEQTHTATNADARAGGNNFNIENTHRNANRNAMTRIKCLFSKTCDMNLLL